MFVIEKKEKPKQGRIQRGFVKGGVGGGGGWYQSTSERNFQLKLFFLVQTRRGVKIVQRLPHHVARARARAIWLGLWKIYECWFIPNCTKKNHVITYNNSTVLGIIRKKEAGGGGVTKTVFSLLQQHVPGAVKVNQTWRPQIMFL